MKAGSAYLKKYGQAAGATKRFTNMDERILTELDFYRIRAVIAGKCVSEEGKKQILHREPFPATQKEEMERLKTLSEQWRNAVQSRNPILLHAWPEIQSFLRILRIENAVLGQEQAFALLQFCDSCLDVYASIKTAASELSLKSLLDSAETMPYSQIQQTRNHISKIVGKDGALKDIPVLRAIKTKIATIHSEIAAALKKYTSDARLNSVLETNVPVLRAERQVLAVKSHQRNRIPGIVHEVSDSGQTLYIEPEEVVRKNNELIQEECHLQQEIRAVFKNLTEQIHPFAEYIEDALRTMILFDGTHAAAVWGIENRCTYARTCAEHSEEKSGAPCLVQARHPLLGEKAVPIDMKFVPGKNVLIITGPNTGGKTVALKTFALLSLLNQAGFPVPAADGTYLPVFSSVFADIGDEQSIDQSLSTFSAHMKRIADAVQNADGSSLVLLDELGSGTDPQEGGAIALAVLDALVEKRSFVLVTTHHGILKNYGYTNEFCENASVEFDSSTLSPTYRLIPGVPGESHALDIAIHSGLPAATAEKARSYITNQQADVSLLIKGLTEKNAELAKREAEFIQKESAAAQKMLRLEKKELSLRIKENELKERENRTESQFLAETRKQLENLVRELREGEITREKTLKMRAFITNLTENCEIQEQAAEKERESIENDSEALNRKIEAQQIAENGMRITYDKNRSPSSKKTKKKRSNKEALASAKSTYTDEELINRTPKQTDVHPKKSTFRFTEGAEVLVGATKAKGILVREEKNGVWTVQLGSIRMSVRQKELIPATASKNQMLYTVELAEDSTNGSPVFELRLLGMRTEEAISALQRQLDLCTMTHFKSFSVIHGKGNGILQQAVQDYLSNYPGVKKFYFAQPEDGGFGKTYVEMNV